MGAAESAAWAAGLAAAGDRLQIEIRIAGGAEVTVAGHVSDKDVAMGDGGLATRETLTLLLDKTDYPTPLARGTVVTRVSDAQDYIVEMVAADNNPAFWLTHCYR